MSQLLAEVTCGASTRSKLSQWCGVETGAEQGWDGLKHCSSAVPWGALAHCVWVEFCSASPGSRPSCLV